MKNLIHISRFLLAILFVGCFFSNSWSQLTLPKATVIEAYQDPLPNLLLPTTFYAVGFSQDGKFAYFTEPADEACGCYFFDFFIQDLVTDRILWQYHFNSDRSELKDPPENPTEMWTQKGEEFQAKMARYGIKWTYPKLQPLSPAFPEIQFQNKTKDMTAEFGTVFTTASTLTAHHAGQGQKRISSLSFPNDYVHTIEVGGFFKNPFEERAALLILKTNRGWEGLPKTLQFEVIGVHLEKGFH